MSDKKPQPYQRYEDQGPTQLYVDVEPHETVPGPTPDEVRGKTAQTIEANKP